MHLGYEWLHHDFIANLYPKIVVMTISYLTTRTVLFSTLFVKKAETEEYWMAKGLDNRLEKCISRLFI